MKKKDHLSNWIRSGKYIKQIAKTNSAFIIWIFLKYLSRGLFVPRVRSILTLLTAISSSFSVTPPLLCLKNYTLGYHLSTIRIPSMIYLLLRNKHGNVIITFWTWEQIISWGVMFLKFSMLSLGTENSLQNCKT